MSHPRQRQKFGEYSLGQRLGLGGMAEVREAYHPRFGQVALKRMLPALKKEEKFLAMFEDEARVTSAVQHPNVVHVHEYSYFAGEPFLALELIDGPDVSRVVRSAARKELSWNFLRALALPHQLLSGLEAIHNCSGPDGSLLGLVHRDISPGNLILQSSGGLKIGDFGIASADDIERRTEPGQLKGKLGYMAPEQALGEPASHLSDLYSAGVIAAELLMLRPLFRAESDQDTLQRNSQGNISNWARYNSSVPAPLKLFIETALSIDPKQRYQSATAMLAALVQMAAQAGIRLDDLVARKHVVDTLKEIKAKSGSFRATELLRAVSSPSPHSEERLKNDERATSNLALDSPDTEASDYASRSVYAHLLELYETKTSACVLMNHQNQWLEVILDQGAVTSCVGSAPEYQLGSLLVEEGVILPAQLHNELRLARLSGLRLGEYLQREKKVKSQVIERLLKRQIQYRLASWICIRGINIEVGNNSEAPTIETALNGLPLLSEVLRKHIPNDELRRLERILSQKSLSRSSYYSAREYQEQIIEMACTQAEFRILNLIPAAQGSPLPAHWLEAWQQERIATRQQILTTAWIGLESGLLQVSAPMTSLV